MSFRGVELIPYILSVLSILYLQLTAIICKCMIEFVNVYSACQQKVTYDDTAEKRCDRYLDANFKRGFY